MQTYKTKLEQLIEEIKYKYCPNMEGKILIYFQKYRKERNNLIPTLLLGLRKCEDSKNIYAGMQNVFSFLEFY